MFGSGSTSRLIWIEDVVDKIGRSPEMLDFLMIDGAHRVDLFEVVGSNPLAFGFYIRGVINAEDAYSRDAKCQLYAGLALIQARQEMDNLRGIYIDVDCLDNVSRPAYLQLKRDLIDGLFRRIFVPMADALIGSPVADQDLKSLHQAVGGFELLVCRDGECIPIDIPGL